MSTAAQDAPPAAHLSVFANLSSVLLRDMPAAKAPLAETLKRVLPKPEVQAIPVAAFNSGI